MKDINKLNYGSILSEVSHYRVVSIGGEYVEMVHDESGDRVKLSPSYIKGFLQSADEVIQTFMVTKEDKKDGTPGIRSIFEGINGPEVFTVCFKKQDTPKSKKKLQEEIATIADEFAKRIDFVKTQKMGVAEAAKSYFTSLVNNPILPYEEGEERVLRGYKIQFTSRDGRYDCVDMDIERNEKEAGIRPVNLNTLLWIVLNGVKYVVQ